MRYSHLRGQLAGLCLAFLISTLGTTAFGGDHSRPGEDKEHGDWTLGCTWGNETSSQACIKSTAPNSADRIECLMSIMTDKCTRDDEEKGLKAISPGLTNMTWTMHNNSGHRLTFTAYAQTRSKMWSTGEVVGSPAVRTYTLQCYIGEKICYGMAIKKGTYWGVGESDYENVFEGPGVNKYPCTNCCWTCGKANPEFTLTP